MSKSQRRRLNRLPSIPLGTAFFLVCQTASMFVLSGCRESDVQDKTTDTQADVTPQVADADAHTVDQDDESQAPLVTDPRFPWSVPHDWIFDETPRQMRLATYMAPVEGGQQEIAVTRFPGRVGGELANINRWRGQMGHPPVTEEQLEEKIERFSSDGFDGYQTRIDSNSGVMIAIAVFDQSTEQTWFVRATLPDSETADQLESEISAMARTIMQ